MRINFRTEEEGGYLKPIIEAFLLKELPGIEVSKEVRLDALTKILVNTRQFRLAGSPNPESLVEIRKVIRYAIETNTRIPVLVPSGPKKPGGLPIDVAEFSMMRNLLCLNNEVSKVHAPGIKVRFRLEDETGFYLEGPEIREDVEAYCSGFERLAEILGAHIFEPRRESTMDPEHLMTNMARTFHGDFRSAILVEGAIETVHALGWKGPLSRELVESLHQRFKRVCSGMERAERVEHMSKYLSLTLARARLGLSGTDEAWAPVGPIVISFHPPVPDSPAVSTRLYYRTVPLRHSKRHLPFWRAKGMLRVEEDTVKFVVRHWNEKIDHLPGWLEFQTDDGKRDISLSCNILLE